MRLKKTCAQFSEGDKNVSQLAEVSKLKSLWVLMYSPFHRLFKQYRIKNIFYLYCLKKSCEGERIHLMSKRELRKELRSCGYVTEKKYSSFPQLH